jgi:hypothetical protein
VSVPRWAIDLDGTLIESAWPDLGIWLPGAQDALRELHERRGGALIHTVRVSPLEFPWDGTTTRLRDPKDVQFEIDRTRKLLDEAGFEDVPIWLGPGKPPTDYFVDDRAHNFNPRIGWRRTVRTLPS